MMKEELAERVETAFDEEYVWPLGLAIVLLIVEGLIPEAPLPKLGFASLAMPGLSGSWPDAMPAVRTAGSSRVPV